MPFTVKLEARKGKRNPLSVTQILSATPTGAAFGLANEIKKRVFQQGRPVGRPPRYPSEGKARLVGPRFPGAALGDETPAGAYRFLDSAAFHHAIGTRFGTYNVSGGMAGGLTVIATGRRAFITFRGRSIGQGVKWKHLKRGTVARSLKISNALKAWSIFRHHNINVLDLKTDELEGLAVAIERAVQNGVKSIGGVSIEWHKKGSSRIARRLLRSIEGVRRIG